MYSLFARAGWGSVLVETQLAWYGLKYQTEAVGDLFKEPHARDQLLPANPIAQIPTLILPDGTVMTESAAITLLLADITGRTDLVPEPSAHERAQFLRWLVFIVTNIYPTFTYADDPARFVGGEIGRSTFRANVDAYAKRLWGISGSRGRGAMVPRRPFLRRRYLHRRYDPMATATPVVCCPYAKTRRHRHKNRRPIRTGFSLGTKFPSARGTVKGRRLPLLEVRDSRNPQIARYNGGKTSAATLWAVSDGKGTRLGLIVGRGRSVFSAVPGTDSASAVEARRERAHCRLRRLPPHCAFARSAHDISRRRALSHSRLRSRTPISSRWSWVSVT